MHGITMIFLFVTPMLSGFGNYLVPLLIGARDMAFPRLNAFGYWVFLGAGLFIYSSLLLGTAPDDGWFNYAPLSTRARPGANIDFYGLGLIFLGDLDDRRRDQLHRHDLPAARAGDVAQPDAALLLGDARDVALDRLRAPVADGRLPAARARSASGASTSSTPRTAATRCSGSTCSGSSATPTSTSSSCPPSGSSRRSCRSSRGGRWSATRWSSLATMATGVPRLRRLGAPHVRRRAAAAVDDVLRGGEHGDRDPERDPGLRLAGDDHRAAGRCCATPFLFVLGFIVVVRDRRPVGRDVRRHPVRPAGDRLVLRRRALPLRAVRRRRVPDPRRAPLLAAEDERPHARRAARRRRASGSSSSAST